MDKLEPTILRSLTIKSIERLLKPTGYRLGSIGVDDIGVIHESCGGEVGTLPVGFDARNLAIGMLLSHECSSNNYED